MKTAVELCLLLCVLSLGFQTAASSTGGGVFFKKPGDTLQQVLPRIDPNSQLTWRRPEEKEESLVVTLVDNQVTCVGQFEDRCELNSSTSELRLLNLTAADTGHLLLRNSSDEVVWTGYVSVEGVVLVQGETLRHTLKNTVHLLRLCLRCPGTETDVLVMTVDHNTSDCTGRFTDRCGYNSSTAEFWLNDLTVSDTGLYIARNLDKEVVWACNVDVKSNSHSPQNILHFQVLVVVVIIGIVAVCFLCILLYKALETRRRN